MIPTGLGALSFLLALVPGWFYLRLLGRIRARTRPSGVTELLEIVAVGVLTSGTAILIVVLLPRRLLPMTIDVNVWAVRGEPYLRENVRQAAWTVVILLGLAMIIASCVYAAQRLWNAAEFRADGNVWVQSLGDRPTGTFPWVGLHLVDGRLVEGVLHSFSLDDLADGRDVALAGPVRFTPCDYARPGQLVDLDRLIVPFRQVDYIAVRHLAEAPPTNTRSRARRARAWIAPTIRRSRVRSGAVLVGVAIFALLLR